jgi:hypothetical protein
MKPTTSRIERWLSNVEARLISPQRKCLRVKVYEAKDKEKALAELAARTPDAFAGRTVEDLNWSDDMAAVQAKALAEHIAAHPEDVGRTVANFNWIVWEIVLRPQELIEDEHTDKDADKDTDASETLRTGLDQAGSTPELDGKGGPHHNHEPIDLPPPDPGCLARSKPWRPPRQRPARDQRRPTWKEWER